MNIADLFANNPSAMPVGGAMQSQSLGDLLAGTFATLGNQPPEQALGADWRTRLLAGYMRDRIVAKQKGFQLAGDPLSQYERNMR